MKEFLSRKSFFMLLALFIILGACSVKGTNNAVTGNETTQGDSTGDDSTTGGDNGIKITLLPTVIAGTNSWMPEECNPKNILLCRGFICDTKRRYYYLYC